MQSYYVNDFRWEYDIKIILMRSVIVNQLSV
jgi:hypothetical protein